MHHPEKLRQVQKGKTPQDLNVCNDVEDHLRSCFDGVA